MRFREFIISSGKKILAGKDAESNEELVNQVKENEDVFHTAKSGSPFVNIKGNANAKDRKEAAIFCAVKSQDWRDNKSDVIVHVFKGKDIYKEKGMKKGTFWVKKYKKILIRKKDILKFLKNAINK